MFNRVAQRESVTSHNITNIMGKVERGLQYALGVAASHKSVANKFATVSFVEVSIPLSIPHNGTNFLSDNGKSFASGIWVEMANNTLGTIQMKNGMLN